jgi:hypothetical protein
MRTAKAKKKANPTATARPKTIAVDLSFVAVGGMTFTERNTGLALSVFVAPDGLTFAVAAHGADFMVKEACQWFAAQMCEQAPGGKATASKPETFKADNGDAVTRVVVEVRSFTAPPVGVT